MGIHSIQVRKVDVIRLAGYKMTQLYEHVELVPRRWNKAWPKLADRFQSLGALKSLETGVQGIKIFVSLDLAVVEAMITGRRRPRRFPKVIAFGILVPVLILASLIPIKSGVVERIPEKVTTSSSQPCSLDAIGRWLQGTGETEDIKIQGTSVLGGVTVGTLDCKESRYSYTLGSEEPKRVIKLQKLDS